jgi:hypothetical protein
MAKHKRSVALFEVIQSSRTSHKSLSDVLRTPKWWFKRKSGEAGGGPAATGGPADHTAAASPAAQGSSPNVPSLPSTALSTEVESTAPAPAIPGVDLKVDPDRQRITFHITYTSAIVTAFAVLVVVGLAYVIGSKMRSGPSKAAAESSTERLRQGAPRGDVLNVRPNSTQRPAPPPADPDDAITPVPQPPRQQVTSTTQPTQRIIGLNYVVMQGYPPEERAMAVEARDLLIKNGIACTIEQDLPGLNRNWHIVVGLQGFERIGYNPEFDKYEGLVRKVNDKFPRNAKFKKLEPMPYKWRG